MIKLLILLCIIGVVSVKLPTVLGSSPTSYGVFFSPMYAEELGLNWHQVYFSLLADLGVKHLRLPSYWNRTAPTPTEIDFSELDQMLKLASENQATVSLVLGNKQPRWPECHTPEWALKMTPAKRQTALFSFIAEVVQRYQTHPEIVSWQVENEPYFGFGPACPTVSRELLSQEVKLVRSLDPTRPIILTDSGEWRLSTDLIALSDILGISLYRQAYNDLVRGYISYPFPSWYYPFKDKLARLLAGSVNHQTIITELQAEPWLTDLPINTPIATHLKLFPPQSLKDNLEYAQRTGFSEIYFWGAEWWYYMKLQGHSEYWQIAKDIF